MISIISRRLLIPVAALAMCALGSQARADVVFHNITDQPITFTMSCTGTSQDQWTVAPHDQQSLYCTNGSSAALVEIRTAHDGFDEVVRKIVLDGNDYDLGYDNDGDVNIDHS